MLFLRITLLSVLLVSGCVAQIKAPAASRLPVSARLGLGTAAASACAPATGYSHCRQLAIDHTQVGGTALTNFPALVTLSLGAARIQNASCYDVVFTADSAGASLIPWEQEAGLCNSSTGSYGAHVLQASISSSVDTVFYVSYGKGSVGAPQNTGANGPTHVWDTNFVAVYHLPDGVAVTASDSTSTGNSGSVMGSVPAAVGQIDGAASFSGSYSNYVAKSSPSSIPTGTAARTISFWGQGATAAPAFQRTAVWSGDSNFTGALFAFGINSARQLQLWGASANATANTPVSASAWYHATITYDGVTVRFYLNGSPDGTATPALNTTATSNLWLGHDDGYYALWDGRLDEVRMSKVARTAQWIAAEYNNQKTGSSFVTIGTER